ncbi:MAG: hypothetical protein R2865_02480 [Deinococcales bacterium]
MFERILRQGLVLTSAGFKRLDIAIAEGIIQEMAETVTGSTIFEEDLSTYHLFPGRLTVMCILMSRVERLGRG